MNSRWGRVLFYELKTLLGQPATVGALLLLWAVGCYSLYYGLAEVAKQRRIIAAYPGLQRATDEAYLTARFGKSESVGRVAFYLTQPTVNEPSAQAALALGVRDLHPYCLGVRLLGLRTQLYDSNLDNPVKVGTGNVDFSFVLVTLCPLVIIALTYNLLSAEEERGTLRMLQTTSTSLRRILMSKLMLRAVLVTGSADALFAGGWLLSGAGLHPSLAGWLLCIHLYLAFWFAVCLFCIALRRSSSWNATSLLAAWLVWTAMLPALFNLASAAALPIAHGFEISMQARQTMNEGWDKPKAETFAPFLARHPEWRALCHPVLDNYTWTWYYAMHQVADDSVADKAAAYRDGLMARQRWAEWASVICPPVAAQLMLDQLAGTDLRAQLNYWDAVEGAHRAWQEKLYPRIFQEENLNPQATRALSREVEVRRFQADQPSFPSPAGLLALPVLTLVLLAGAARQARRGLL